MKDIAAALAKAQSTMQNATLNKTNPHFRSRYADLAAIRDAAVPALAAEGIAVVQEIATREFGPVVVTRLLKGEEEIASECPVIVGANCKPQEFGSALTYARRYSLASIVGISAEEDDDANAAQDTTKAGAPATPKATRAAPTAPDVPTVPVTQTDDDQPDWPTFVAAFKEQLANAKDAAWVNAFVKAHNGAISNLKSADARLYTQIETAVKKRRESFTNGTKQKEAA